MNTHIRRYFTLPLAAIASLALGGVANSGTLDKIKASGTITFGYREASIPFSYLGGDQKPVGFSLDICAWVADSIKADLKMDRLAINYVPVNASNRIPLVQNGTVDIECGSTTNTLDRQKQVAFTVATFVSQPKWMVMNASSIKDESDLKGKTVVITQGSLNLLIGQKINTDDKLGLSIVQGKDHAESLLMLSTDRAAGFFEDNILLAGLKASASNPGSFRFLPDSYSGFYYYGLMLAKNDPDFKVAVDKAIKAKMASGEFTKLYAKWFMAPIPPRGQNLDLPMSNVLKTRVVVPSDVVDN